VTDVQPAVNPERCSLPTTVRGSTWYVFLPLPAKDSPTAAQEVTVTCDEPPRSVKLLRTGQELTVSFSDNIARFGVGCDPQMKTTEIVEILWK
jgi:hypothetical protein